MALKDRQEKEDLRLRKRHLMQFLLTLPLVAALYGFASLQAKAPDWPDPLREAPRRGAIVARDGTIFAEGAVEYRRYPQGRLASHVIGFSGKLQPGGNYGLEGLEFTLEERLQAGESVAISIDPRLQAIAQDELRMAIHRHQAENGTVVMLEVGTGRILAAASYPDYDPNLRETRTQNAIINRAFLQQVEPGSTMKPFVIAALIEMGRLHPQETLPVAQWMRVGSQTFTDVTQHDPILNLSQILRHSSNVAMIVLGNRMTAQELHDAYRAFNFGRELRVPYAFTRSGQMNPPAGWVPQDHASASIGQSLSVTGLQLAAAYSILANDGLYIAPRLVEDTPVQDPIMVLSPETAREMREMLIYTVENSSLRSATVPGVLVAGKSGTADIFDQQAMRYLKGDYTMSFGGYFPADDPRVTMVIYLQKPRIGTLSSLVVAPVFGKIALETVAHWNLVPPTEVASTR